MSCYIDTSVLVALCTNEIDSTKVDKWYSNYKGDLVSAIWCITEFASALSIKQRMKQITSAQAAKSWEQFQQLCSGDINLLPLEPAEYYAAATMILNAKDGLRAGDALHLACAKTYGSQTIATLDKVMAKSAKKLKMENIF